MADDRGESTKLRAWSSARLVGESDALSRAVMLGVPGLSLSRGVMELGGASVRFGLRFKHPRRLLIQRFVRSAARDPLVLPRPILTLAGPALAIAGAVREH